jgi:uncharacterized protein
MSGCRVGLVADTHIPEAGPDLPVSAYDLLATCDRILHCGDLHTLEVVDRLEKFAPTLVSRGNGDPRRPRRQRPGVAEDPRVRDVVVLEVHGLRIGMTHDLSHTEGRPDEVVAGILARTFDGPVDIAVSGHSHVPSVWGLRDGTALVNPGSPTMPYGYLDLMGTIGIVDIEPGRFEITIHDLSNISDTRDSRNGNVQLRLVGPGLHQPQVGPRPVGGR